MIRFEDINPENWRLGLKVGKEQERFVSDSMKLLARAYAYRNSRSRAFVIYDDETPIGMALYYDYEKEKQYIFSEFFIDEQYQHRGYGTQAAKMIIDMMRADGKYSKVALCYIDGNTNAEKLYKKLGFVHTFESDGDEIIMKLDLNGEKI